MSVFTLHQINKFKLKSVVALSLATMLSACGGSSNSNDAELENPPMPATPELVINLDTVANIVGRDGANSVAILSNDTIDDSELTLEHVSIRTVNADAPLSLNEDGTLNIAEMTPAGAYSLQYEVCLLSDDSICATGDVNVQVLAADLKLSNDAVANLNGGFENANVLNVLTNDTLANAGINATEVTVTISESSEYLALIDNMLSVSANTPAGEYSLTYQVCENLNPDNCAESMVTAMVDKGVFMNGVSGLKYSSNSTSGFTDEDGGYQYSAGDEITFYIGGTQLGETISAKANITPEDLITSASLPRTSVETNSFYIDFRQGKLTTQEYAMVNILVLLYGVDSDKDGSNNVSINVDVHDVLATRSFDLYNYSYRFSDSQLTFELFKVYKQDLIANASTPEEMVALDHTYELLGIEKNVYTVNNEIYMDFNNPNTYVYPVSYDQENHEVNWEWYELDEEGEEVPDSRGSDVEYYNANGNYLGYESFEDDYFYKSEYVRDIHGNVLLSQNNNDGDIGYIQTYQYNEDGLQSYYSRDSNGDGELDSITTKTYDEQGRLFEEARDHNADTKPDYITRYYYTDGKLSKKQEIWDASYDENAINIIDQETLYEYNDNGDLLKETVHNYSSGVTRVEDYVYDEHGNNTFVYHDQNTDIEGYSAISAYTYDDRGNNLTYSFDNNADGSITNLTENTYNEQNLVTKYVYYSNGDMENPRFVTHRTYNQYGSELTYEYDNAADGSIDASYESKYDEHNNLIEDTYFENGLDSGITYKSLYEYQQTSFLGRYAISYF